MAINRLLVALFFILLLTEGEPYTSQILKGSVTCLDCPQGSDLSGIQILMKCDKVKKLGMAYTERDGTFQTELPSDGAKSTTPSKCMARITGGPQLIYTSSKDSLIPFDESKESSHYFTMSKSLNFYRRCPMEGKCGDKDSIKFGSTKTMDLPLPREWGLPPSSYYIPFFPIIGIP
ncbi:hypothetical protein OROGR_022173 [Orobanche gracilis]